MNDEPRELRSENGDLVRPADSPHLWTLPSSGDSKMTALYAVWKGGPNWYAFNFTCAVRCAGR